MFTIQAFPSGPFDTNAYVFSCSSTKEAAIIDPAPESASSITSYITSEHLHPKMILLTHSHWDHIADVDALKKLFSIPVMIHAKDAPNLEHPGADGLPCWFAIPSVKADTYVQEGDTIKLGTLTFKVIETPGHTPGGVCFYEAQEGILFSGDTLFKGTIGNLSFPTSVPDLMWKSLEKLAKLPSATRVFPGHGPSTTIGQEHQLLKNTQEFFGS